MRIFFLAEFIPKPDIASGDRRLLAFLELLAKRHAVDLAVLRDESRPETLPAWESGDADTRQNLTRLAKQELPRYRQTVEDRGIRIVPFGWKHIGAALAGTRYDVGIFEYYWMAEAYQAVFRRCQPGAVALVDSVDVCFARTERGAVLGQEAAAEAATVKRRELAAFHAADGVIVVSEDDNQLLRSLPEMPPTFFVPNIVPIRPHVPRATGKECLFVGGFKHQPNVDGVLWFVREVWPIVRTAEPEALLTIVGSHPPEEIVRLPETVPGVTVTGYVPDTNPYLDRCAISIAPLRWGGGMKGKVSEAVACGVPVVTTPIGAQGFPAENGSEMIIADNPDAFARGVIELLSDPLRAERMGLAGQGRLATLCSPESVGERIESMLHTIVPIPRPSERFSLRWLVYRLGFPIARALHQFRPTKLLLRKAERRITGVAA